MPDLSKHNLNPEKDAQRTIADFQHCADGSLNINTVWQEMSDESQKFGHGTAADKAYFHTVSEDLKSSGVLPAVTLEYAQWRQDEMSGDNGNISKTGINRWAEIRELQNHRVCEVEQTLLGNLKGQYDNLTFHGATEGIAPYALNDALQGAQQQVHQDEMAGTINHGLFVPQPGDTTDLYTKLSQSNSGQYIDQTSIDAALTFDSNQRQRQYVPGKKWHSYLGYNDHVVVKDLQGEFSTISGGNDRVTKQQLVVYATKHHAE